MNTYEVAQRLIGPIKPVGDSAIDRDRLKNLKMMCILVENLVADIDAVEYDFKNNHQASMKNASEVAGRFLDRLGIERVVEG